MNVPADLKYTKDHEWIKVDGDIIKKKPYYRGGDRIGISGLEKYFDKELKDKELFKKPLELTLDSNIQYIVNKELNEAMTTFNATGGGALLMDVNNGNILSLVSLPNFDINKREKIKITRITANTVLIIKSFLSFTAFKISLASSDTTIYPISFLLILILLKVLTKKLF